MSRKPNPVLPRWLRDLYVSGFGLIVVFLTLLFVGTVVIPTILSLNSATPDRDEINTVRDAQQRAHTELGRYLDDVELVTEGFTSHIEARIATDADGTCYVAALPTRGSDRIALITSRATEWVHADEADPAFYTWCVPSIAVITR